MPQTLEGPIEHYSFGKFIIQGVEHSTEAGCGKDIRIIGGKVSAWEERKGHVLEKEMVKCVYDQSIEVLVIGNGAQSALEVPKKVVEKIKEHGIQKVIVQDTARACETYNQLWKEGKRVALLAHGTC